MKASQIKVIGKVQGVAFRYYTKLKADELGIIGTVENLSDGSVKIISLGDDLSMNTFINWCHSGSQASTVKTVEVTNLENHSITDYHGFNILR